MISLNSVLPDLISGLVGVIAGGILTYYGSVRLERKKGEEVIARLHCLLINEVGGHEVLLFSELDHVLPAWLRRDDPIWREGNQLPFKPKYGLLSTISFYSYIEQMVFSPLLVPLSTYYQAVKAHNKFCERLRSTDSVPNHEVVTYVQSCQRLFDASVMAIEELLKTKYAKKFFTPLLQNVVGEFKYSKQEHLYIAVLAKFKYEHLEEWGQEIEKSGADAELPSPLNTDKGALMLKYLGLARNIYDTYRFDRSGR